MSSVASKSSKLEADSSEDEGSSADEGEHMAPTAALVAASGGSAQQGRSDPVSIDQLKREKRLAMNRESARARRRRKKIRLETLEQRAEDLSQRHHNLVLTNQGLKERVTQLEAELEATRTGTGMGIMGGFAGTALTSSGVDPSAASLSAANLGLSAERRAALALQQQSAMSHIGGSGGAAGATASSLSSLGMGATLSNPEMQYLQMQQLMSQQDDSRLSIGGGSDMTGVGASAAARLMAMQDMQAQMARTSQFSALRTGTALGTGHQILGEQNRLNMIPDLRRLDEMGHIRASENLRNPSVLDLARSPVDATAANLAQQSRTSVPGGAAFGGSGSLHHDLSGRRNVKSEDLSKRLADTNKKFPRDG